MKQVLILFAVFLISSITTGCANVQPKLSPELQSEFDAPLHCKSNNECKVIWERATYFVTKNAGFKLQIHNDTIIETYNPSPSSPRLAFRISKEPLGDGVYRIWTQAWCDNMFGCQPNHIETMARAKQYMRSGSN